MGYGFVEEALVFLNERAEYPPSLSQSLARTALAELREMAAVGTRFTLTPETITKTLPIVNNGEVAKFKIPYPNTILEYINDFSGKEVKYILLLTDNGGTVVCKMLRSVKEGVWVPYGCEARIMQTVDNTYYVNVSATVSWDCIDDTVLDLFNIQAVFLNIFLLALHGEPKKKPKQNKQKDKRVVKLHTRAPAKEREPKARPAEHTARGYFRGNTWVPAKVVNVGVGKRINKEYEV